MFPFFNELFNTIQHPIGEIARDWDVIVIGAGPAGSMAALTVARAGFRTLLLDRRSFPRDKCCGDAVSYPARNFMVQIDVWRAVESSAWRTQTISAYTRKSARISLDFPFYFIPRKIFDARLVEFASREGVTFAQASAVEITATETVSRIVVRDGGEPLRAQYVVIATGADNRLAVSSGLFRPEPPNGFGIRRYYALADRISNELQPFGVFPSGLAGYGWVFPVGSGLVNIGVGMISGDKSDYKRCMDYYQRMTESDEQVRALIENAAPAGEITGGWLRMGFAAEGVAARGRVFSAGDAAALACKFDGGGIHAAMRSGWMAGMAIAQALKGEIKRPDEAYRHSLRRKFGREYALWNRLATVHHHFRTRDKILQAVYGIGAAKWYRPKELGLGE